MAERSFTALVNPVSGRGRAAEAWGAVAALLGGADAVVVPTQGRAHAVAAARAAAAAGRVAVAVGGDGLVRDVAEGTVRGGGVMGIVPAGRGNDLARALALPGDPAGLAEVLLHAPARPLDVIDLGGTIVAGNVYAGIDAVASVLINRSRRLPAGLTYRVAPVRAIMSWRAPTFTLVLDGATRRVRAHSIVVGNSGAYGHGMRIVPPARMDDGLLHVLIVHDGPRRAIVSFMRAAERGAHVDRPDVEIVTARSVSIAADRPVPVCGDGEHLGELPAVAGVLPGALRLVSPAGGAALGPSR